MAADSRVHVAPVGHEDLELVEDDDCNGNLINHEKVQDSQLAQGYVELTY